MASTTVLRNTCVCMRVGPGRGSTRSMSVYLGVWGGVLVEDCSQVCEVAMQIACSAAHRELDAARGALVAMLKGWEGATCAMQAWACARRKEGACVDGGTRHSGRASRDMVCTYDRQGVFWCRGRQCHTVLLCREHCCRLQGATWAITSREARSVCIRQ